MVDPAAVAANLDRIRALVGPGVEILAATKYVEPDDLPALREAGITLVGENRTDSMAAKQERFGDLFTWDFIGHVQSRKVRDLVGRVRLIHAVDSQSACEQLETRRAPNATIDCLLQVRRRRGLQGGGGAGGGGRVPGGGRAACGRALPRAHDDAARGGHPELARPWFAALRELRDRLAPEWGGRHEFAHLSMGTSQDFAVAAQEGGHDRAGGWRPVRAVEFVVTWP